jgi:hypothetical protein
VRRRFAPAAARCRSATAAGSTGRCVGTFYDLAAYKDVFTPPCGKPREPSMLGTILLVILVVLIIGAIPTWPYSSGWGYYPSGGMSLLLIVLLVMVLTGRI